MSSDEIVKWNFFEGKDCNLLRADKKPGNPNIQLITDKGVLLLIPEGDCCASSWFEHVSNVQALRGRIQKWEQVVLPYTVPKSEQNDWGVTDQYFYKLHTEFGICTFEMRTAHNGYYGGYIEFEVLDYPFDWPELEEF